MAKGWRKKSGRLTAQDRQSMPKSDFALPGHGDGPKGAGSGSYPIPDRNHAKVALAMVSRYGDAKEKKAVRSKVASKFPGIGNAKADKRYGARSH